MTVYSTLTFFKLSVRRLTLRALTIVFWVFKDKEAKILSMWSVILLSHLIKTFKEVIKEVLKMSVFTKEQNVRTCAEEEKELAVTEAVL